MEEIFFVSPNDKGLSTLLKREANIILASLNKESNEYLYKKERFEEALSVVRAIEYTKSQNENEIDFILNTINRIRNIGILSPLTLKEDEFLNSLLVLKALYGHVYTKEMVLNQCDKFGFRSYNVCVELYKKGYWNESRRN